MTRAAAWWERENYTAGPRNGRGDVYDCNCKWRVKITFNRIFLKFKSQKSCNDTQNWEYYQQRPSFIVEKYSQLYNANNPLHKLRDASVVERGFKIEQVLQVKQ